MCDECTETDGKMFRYINGQVLCQTCHENNEKCLDEIGLRALPVLANVNLEYKYVIAYK